MPLKLSDKLPAIDILKQENIFIMGEARAQGQDIRPLRIVILNLMPLKITTETDLIRLLSNTPLQIEIVFMRLKSHTPKHTPIEHMLKQWILRLWAIGMKSCRFSTGHALMLRVHSTFVGRLWPGFIISMASQNMR